MKKIYACPHCDTVLNPSVKILLVVSYRKKKGLILLSPKPGNFQTICDDTFEHSLKPGAKVHFSCPVCAEDLTSKKDPEFVELKLLSPGHEPRTVEFSRVYGKQATFIIDGDDVTTFGRDVSDPSNTNFFGS